MNAGPTHREFFCDENRPDPSRLSGWKLLCVWMALCLLSWALVLALVGAIIWLF